MGSPLSSPLAEIVMQQIDRQITGHFPTEIQIWSRYIDDIFCLCHTETIDSILTKLKDFHKEIDFTLEKETNGKLPFLNIFITRQNQKFNTTSKTDVFWTCDARISRRDIADSVRGKSPGEEIERKETTGIYRRSKTMDWTTRGDEEVGGGSMERPFGPPSVEEGTEGGRYGETMWPTLSRGRH
ncbi:hypothetical protein LAZ67_17002009 [Cordylochernes scorpioides]|uniref:Reverse transcriptase domain-containing protein n=1 Tax=Cordylochernes scorpioides TaxID=51811 RepID=A0ABY6LDP3_9ARAC|nr:hypothetical protein LAZ67_17002009 [Cordylochernes scorpioides]